MNELVKISQLLSEFSKQAASYDQSNKIPTLANKAYFEAQLFKSQSRQLISYVYESQELLQQIQKLIDANAAKAMIAFQCDKLVDQCQAIKKALGSQSQRTNSYRQDKRLKAQAHQQKAQKNNPEYAWLTQKIIGSSQKLYQELSKHHEYRQTFDQKIAKLNQQLMSCPPEQKIVLQQSILTVYKRLGQCNKAIYFIEQKIERLQSGKKQY